MWGRPVRQATAHAKPVHGAPVGAALDVLVHRNELNEQQRPGQLVLVPLKQATGGSSRWSAKLLRNMKCKEDGATITACEGLLFYTGEQINHDDLDPKGIIPMALKKACVCFITNQVDSADSGSGMVSGMKGTPVEVGPDGSLVDIRTRVVLRGRAGVPEKPEDSSKQYSLANNKWVTEEELNKETQGDRKRKYPFTIDTLYK